MSIKNIVWRSRSCRRFYEGHRLSKKILRELINLARLSPSAANLQPLKYILSYGPLKNDLIFPTLAWAAYLKDWRGPEKGERPSGYVVILGDKAISKDFYYDCGIAAQGIMLGAVEKGLGGCIIGSIDRDLLRRNLNIAEQYDILLVIALGRPKEKTVIEESLGGDIKYFRDAKDIHHVPKRPLDEIIIG